MQVFRYFLVGGASAVIDISLFTFLTYALKYHWLQSSVISFICATLINYFLSIRFVFTSGNRHSKNLELVSVFVVSLLALCANQIILYICIELLYFNLIFSKFLSILLVFFLNYFGRKYFVF
jgi:putative flippase GtrA